MTYEELVTAAKLYADRNDIEVSESFPTFILMAEARINRVLKTREQSARAYTPTADMQEYYPLPPDYRGIRSIQLNSGVPYVEHSVSIFNQVNPEQLDSLRAYETSSKLYYCIVADQFQIYPIQSTGKTIEILYYQKVPALTENSPTNWLSEEHPDIYMSGIIAEIESFVKNYEVSKMWDDKMSRTIKELETSDVNERWGGAPLTMKNG